MFSMPLSVESVAMLKSAPPPNESNSFQFIQSKNLSSVVCIGVALILTLSYIIQVVVIIRLCDIENETDVQ